MAICMATGEAAGIAAAQSIKKGVTPRELNVQDVRSALRLKGVSLD